MFQYLKSFSLALLLSVGIGSVGKAASFDCNKATTETEKAICNDPELSALDEILASLFQTKVSINFESELQSDYGDEVLFPSFLSTDTRTKQRLWINNNQLKCYSNTICLVRSYLDRISDFFALKDQDDGRLDGSWRITEKHSIPGGEYSVIIWEIDSNTNDDYGCFSETYKPIFYVITVHNSEGGLIDHNIRLLPSLTNSCVMLEYGIESLDENNFSVSTSTMMSAGGWGATTKTFTFKINEDNIFLKAYQVLEYARNVHLFETTFLDFKNKLLKIEYDNGSEEAQTVRGKIIVPGEKLEHVLYLDNLPTLSFNNTSSSLMYDLVNLVSTDGLTPDIKDYIENRNLDEAQRQTEFEISKGLLPYRCSDADSEGRSALHYLAKQKDTKPLMAFLEQDNSNINCVDDYGETPLHFAAALGSVHSIQILLENGADPSFQNNIGQGVLALAQENPALMEAAILNELANKFNKWSLNAAKVENTLEFNCIKAITVSDKLVCEAPAHLLSSLLAPYGLIKQNLSQITRLNEACVSFEFEIQSNELVEWELREIHDVVCGGDPGTAPKIASLKTNKKPNGGKISLAFYDSACDCWKWLVQ